MLKRLHLQNFTVFADAEFEFGPGLNVLVGANGTGKTHVLKAGYTADSASSGANKTIKGAAEAGITDGELVVTTAWIISISQALKELFLVEELNTLVRKNSVNDAVLRADMDLPNEQIAFKIKPKDEILGQPGSIYINSLDVPELRAKTKSPFVFIPAKEVLTMGWLLSVYDRYGAYGIPVDRTYPDVIRLLTVPAVVQPEPYSVLKMLHRISGGRVEEQNGRFYLVIPSQPRLEMNLVAEGMRKFATLYKLLANGTLTPETTLFWDEPEANLNPALLKELAAVLTEMAQAGFQVILATHSLFLMRELHILAQKNKPVRYFGLYAGEEGDVRVETTNDLLQLQHLVALDAELKQTFDFEAALDEEYAGD